MTNLNNEGVFSQFQIPLMNTSSTKTESTKVNLANFPTMQNQSEQSAAKIKATILEFWATLQYPFTLEQFYCMQGIYYRLGLELQELVALHSNFSLSSLSPMNTGMSLLHTMTDPQKFHILPEINKDPSPLHMSTSNDCESNQHEQVIFTIDNEKLPIFIDSFILQKKRYSYFNEVVISKENKKKISRGNK